MNFNKILIAVDGSPLSVQAAEWGFALGKKLNAAVALVYVADTGVLAGSNETGLSPKEIMAEQRKAGKEAISTITENKSGDKKPFEFFAEGKPHEQILETAMQWCADIIVLGSHGRSGIKRLLMGSVAENVLRHSQWPVFIITHNSL